MLFTFNSVFAFFGIFLLIFLLAFDDFRTGRRISDWDSHMPKKWNRYDCEKMLFSMQKFRLYFWIWIFFCSFILAWHFNWQKTDGQKERNRKRTFRISNVNNEFGTRVCRMKFEWNCQVFYEFDANELAKETHISSMRRLIKRAVGKTERKLGSVKASKPHHFFFSLSFAFQLCVCVGVFFCIGQWRRLQMYSNKDDEKET